MKLIIKESQLLEQVMWISPEFIKTDENILYDKSEAEDMYDAIISGDNLPPVTLDRDNTLIDGEEVYVAHRMAKSDKVPFKYKEYFKT
jgi:hypothetical protein